MNLEPGARMRSEIAEQPDRWIRFAGEQSAGILAAAKVLTDSRPELLIFAARGSSDHAAQYAQYLAHSMLQVPAMLATPSSITVDSVRLAYPRSVIIAVSQSGESPDLLETVADARGRGVPVVAITNAPQSPLAALADVHVDIMAGAELSVAATKTYTSELLALLLVLTRAAGTRPVDVHALAAGAWAVLGASEVEAADEASALAVADRLLAVGRGPSTSSAKEAALKLMETCAISASGWSAADATHGPLGQVVPGTPVLAFAAAPGGRRSVEDFVALATANGARVVSVLSPMEGVSSTWAEDAVGPLSGALAPLLEILPVQRVALEVALLKGRDPDAPQGLHKVTHTR